MKSLKHAGAILSLLAVLSPSAAFASQQPLALTDPDFRIYKLKVARRVRQNWRAPTNSYNYPIVWFVLAPDGQASSVRIYSSSKDKALDQKAVAAISTSAPFSAFPTSFNKAPGIGFLFRFSKDFTLNRFDRTVCAFVSDSKKADETQIEIVTSQWGEQKHKEVDDFVSGKSDRLNGVDVSVGETVF